MSRDAPPTSLRTQLYAVEPKNFSMKKAFRELIRGLRIRKRMQGNKGRLSSMADLDRAMSMVPPFPALDIVDDLEGIKRNLRLLAVSRIDALERSLLAHEVDEALVQLLPPVTTQNVVVTIAGWPLGFGDVERSRLISLPWADPLTVPPTDAVRLLRRLDGLLVGGSTLSVLVHVPDGMCLPSLKRSQRHRRPQRREPWLPEVDRSGRAFLTPHHLAREQAQGMREMVGGEGGLVVDLFCGCGGNSIAFAQAGLRVIALEKDAHRARLARENANAMGVGERIEVRNCDAVAAAVPLLKTHPEAGVFVDPPWTGDEDPSTWDQRALPMSAYLPWPALRDRLAEAGALMMKTPRSFDVASLPDAVGAWQVQYGFGHPSRGDEDVVKLITVWRKK